VVVVIVMVIVIGVGWLVGWLVGGGGWSWLVENLADVTVVVRELLINSLKLPQGLFSQLTNSRLRLLTSTINNTHYNPKLKNPSSYHPLTHLLIQQHMRHSQTNKAREEGLVEFGVLLEGGVLHYGRQLVVVADQAHAEKPAPFAAVVIAAAAAAAAATATAAFRSRCSTSPTAVVVGSASKGAVGGWLKKHGDNRFKLQHLIAAAAAAVKQQEYIR
jgi:hypothetical protein